ncbi:uncharacterized protein LOC121866017 [Homarus americanus]|uniref:Zinc finger protein 318-like n=1 Tax=Homarus americanus TaxID=6706 RepID=A0A8J5K4J5_HOMAM|nr:uncharacterized protein LOC121866017 [Homarus americanus]XP_042221533.1 uncharacterized protein LOC121866017 [Homarus americanus]KAG7169291.1 Zinc finger protein 318-like [Homarus americanus]
MSKFRNKIPETCRYWKEGKCFKGEFQCNFVHGYVCPDDRRCRRENCTRFHLSQMRRGPPQREYRGKQFQNHPRQGHRDRYRRSRSRSISPLRHQKTFHRSRTPPRHRSRSRSPPYHPVKSYSSPHCRSRSLSPSRYHRSTSWRQSRSSSPARFRSRSCSPVKSRSRSRVLDRSRSRSRSIGRLRSRSFSIGRLQSRSRSPAPYRSKITPPHHEKSISPSRLRSRSNSQTRPQAGCSQSHRRSRSRSITQFSSKSFSTADAGSRSCSISNEYSRSHSRSQLRSRSSSPSQFPVKNWSPSHSQSPPHHQSKNRSSSQDESAGNVQQLDFEDIYADLEEETLGSSAEAEKHSVDKLVISELQARITRNFMNPHTQKLMKEILKSTSDKSKDISPKPPISQRLQSPNESAEVDQLGLDLEEVGEEVDDIFTKSIARTVDDSIESDCEESLKSSKRQKELQVGSNPCPPKPKPLPKPKQPLRAVDIDYHTDWELKTSLENLSRPIEGKQNQAPMAPPKAAASGSKSNSSSLWTPALDRRQLQESKLKISYHHKASDWEIETPYVGRKDKNEAKQEDSVSGRETKTGSRGVMSSVTAFSQPEPGIPYENNHLTNERILEQSMENASQSKTMLFPSGQSISTSVPSTISHGVMTNISTSSSAAVGAYGVGALSTSSVQSADLMREYSRVRQSFPSPEGGGRSSKKVSGERKARKSSESPKRSKHKRHKEKKSKRKKESSDSESESEASNHDKREPEKKSSPEPEKEKCEVEALLTKRESLMKRVKMLMEQKNMMNEQREDIIKNHKGSRDSLFSLLEENSLLMTEIGKQILKINNMAHKVDQEIKGEGGDIKQSASVSRERSKSPYHSRERQRKSGYSSEREKQRKTSYYHSPEKTELNMSPLMKTKRTRSPQRKESWSPPPSKHKSGESSRSTEHAAKLSKHNTSRSPAPGLPKESKKHFSSPESQRSLSPPKKRRVNSSTETAKKQVSLRGKGHQETIKEEVDETLQYAPLTTQRTFIRYMDQGMHWCKLCSLFCETVPEYVSHLMTLSHMARVKNDRKSWLAKAPREQKEVKPANAQVLTVPLQGLEFIHSLPAYYCSLCDIFMRDKGETVRHPESKTHVSNYKVHRAKNPMYESTFLKAKTAAYAKYSIDEERKLLEGQLNLKEKTIAHDIQEKLMKQIKEKRDRDREKDSRDDRSVADAKDDKAKGCGSIRVASRGPSHSSDKKSDNRQKHKDNSKRHSEERQAPSQEDSNTKSKSRDDCLRGSDQQKNVKGGDHQKNVKGGEQQKNEHIHSTCSNDKEKKDADVNENETLSKSVEEPSKDKEEEKKSAVPKLPLIGKMPFLKKRPAGHGGKEQHNTTRTKQQAPTQHELHIGEAKTSTNTENQVDPKKVGDSLFPIAYNMEIIREEADVKMNITQENPVAVNDNESTAENISTCLNEVKDLSPAEEPSIYFEEPSNEPMPMDFEDSSDSDSFKMFDSMETGNEESSECAAAATLHALDLLSIPLPGLKRATEAAPASDILLPPGTEHEQHCQESSNLSLLPGGDDGPAIVMTEICGPEVSIQDHSSGAWSNISNSKESLLKSTSGSLKKLEIPLPPGTEDSSQVQEGLPPPPGTEYEAPNYHLGGDSDVVIPLINVAPVFEPGFQDLSSGAWSMGSNSQEGFGMSLIPTASDKTAEILLPPGTEDEHVQEISCLPLSSTVADNISVPGSSDQTGVPSQAFIQQHNLGLCSSGSDSLEDFPVPPSKSDRPDPAASLSVGIGLPQWPVVQPSRCAVVPDATNFTNWSSLCHTKRECTPPPPGTENMIINELEYTPGELGEASMELSEDSDSEGDPGKRETTPPPPGTESTSKFLSTKSVPSKKFTTPKRTPSTSRHENKEIKPILMEKIDRELPIQIVNKRQSSHLVSKKEKSRKLPSCNEEKEEGLDFEVQISSGDFKVSTCDTVVNDPPGSRGGVESATQHTHNMESDETNDKGDGEDIKVPEFKETIVSSECVGIESGKLISEDPKEIFESDKGFVDPCAIQDGALGDMEDRSQDAVNESEIHTQFPDNINTGIGQVTDIILHLTHESTNTSEECSSENSSDSRTTLLEDEKHLQAPSPHSRDVDECSDGIECVSQNTWNSEKLCAQLDIELQQSPGDLVETEHAVTTEGGEEETEVGSQRTSRTTIVNEGSEEEVTQDQSSEDSAAETIEFVKEESEVEETKQFEEISITLEIEETKVKHSSLRRTSRATKASTVEQELKVKQLTGQRSTRGKKALTIVQEEEVRINLPSEINKSLEEDGQSMEPLETMTKANKEIEIQEQGKEISDSRKATRAKKVTEAKEQPTRAKQSTTRRPVRGKKTSKTLEDKLKAEPVTSQRATRATRSASLENKQEEHGTDAVPETCENISDEEMKGNEGVIEAESNMVTRASSVDKEEDKQPIPRKTTRGKRTQGNEETEEDTCIIEETVHKKNRSASSKSRNPRKETKVANSSRPVRSSRKAAVLASAAMATQTKDQGELADSPISFEETSEGESE